MTEVRLFTILKSVHRRLQRAERDLVVIRDGREPRREVPGGLDTGQHLHPLLRRPRWDGSSGRAGSSA